MPEDWFVNPQVLGEFYEKFKDRTPEEIRRFSFEQGLRLGQKLAGEIGIKTDSIENIAALLSVVLKHEPTAKIVQWRRTRCCCATQGSVLSWSRLLLLIFLGSGFARSWDGLSFTALLRCKPED